MSTRAGIVIIDEDGDTLHFYRHSDGYPKGTMPTLRKFLKLVKEGCIRDNVGQAAGWLIVFGAKETGKCFKSHKRVDMPLKSLFSPKAKERSKEGMGWKVGAFEPTTNVRHHSDLEYVYIVDLKDKTITIHKGGSQSLKMKESKPNTKKMKIDLMM